MRRSENTSADHGKGQISERSPIKAVDPGRIVCIIIKIVSTYSPISYVVEFKQTIT